MMQQSNQNQLPPAAPDETGYYMPNETAGQVDSWVYGEPGQNGDQNGSQNMTPTGDAAMSAASQTPIAGMNGGEAPGGMSSAAAQSQRMKNPVDMARTHMPSGAADAYQASMRSLLNRNIGYFVVATFLVGADKPVTWQGILHSVGTDYVVIYQPDYERYISGDLYALKFVQFHNIKGIPYTAASPAWQGHTNF